MTAHWGGPFGGNKIRNISRSTPHGLVPTVKDGELVMWESNTICAICARGNGERLHPTDPGQRTQVERWMDWQLFSVGPPMGALLFGLIRTRPEQRDPAAVEAARRKALAAWTIADDALDGSSYLAGEELSLAEITLGTLVYRWHAFPIERPPLKNLKGWFDRLRERPAFKKHIEIPIT